MTYLFLNYNAVASIKIYDKVHRQRVYDYYQITLPRVQFPLPCIRGESFFWPEISSGEFFLRAKFTSRASLY